MVLEPQFHSNEPGSNFCQSKTPCTVKDFWKFEVQSSRSTIWLNTGKTQRSKIMAQHDQIWYKILSWKSWLNLHTTKEVSGGYVWAYWVNLQAELSHWRFSVEFCLVHVVVEMNAFWDKCLICVLVQEHPSPASRPFVSRRCSPQCWLSSWSAMAAVSSPLWALW